MKISDKKSHEVISRSPEDIEIRVEDIGGLEKVYDWYQKDFAEEERKEYGHLEKLLVGKKYKLMFARHKVIGEIVGYALVYEIDTPSVLWLDYIAVCEKFRNAGLGTVIFNKIAEQGKPGNMGVFMEVEIPCHEEMEERSLQQRRLRFYERLGAKRLKVAYKLPSPDGGFPMYLYFRPSPGTEIIKGKDIEQAISAAFEYIHSDVEEREGIFNSFIDSIVDEKFEAE